MFLIYLKDLIFFICFCNWIEHKVRLTSRSGFHSYGCTQPTRHSFVFGKKLIFLGHCRDADHKNLNLSHTHDRFWLVSRARTEAIINYDSLGTFVVCSYFCSILYRFFPTWCLVSLRNRIVNGSWTSQCAWHYLYGSSISVELECFENWYWTMFH